ncbi:hypothetical protein DMENIID0001_168040 [Sergentomyia squamirostris]|uniref:uncharacterized protein LOC129801225 isoform X2 n=1 Tax=Phlebotomus papatasi TaxID=29031 RepID=UPI0024840D47|nr:uncharacterized protein LOC129801225 isoform X2 [Phlebotomus papatasi]
MGAKGSVEAAKMNPDSWGHLEKGRHFSHRHNNQRSQSLNRGPVLSRADVGGMW